eukprot:8895876-Pyramimonas_sp.AAC.1
MAHEDRHGRPPEQDDHRALGGRQHHHGRPLSERGGRTRSRLDLGRHPRAGRQGGSWRGVCVEGWPPTRLGRTRGGPARTAASHDT